MKIILSRKGFDSTAGEWPSPIYPSGEMVSLPIPSSTGIRYDRLRFSGKSLGRVVEDLTSSDIKGKHRAHVDPDLRPEALTPRRAGWRPLFGQVGIAQQHLEGHSVGRGDLFLFFGWFRRVIDEDGVCRLDPQAPNLHVVWGWLQVARILPGGPEFRASAPVWAQYHEHFHFDPEGNAIYVARRWLKLPGLNRRLPGGAAFHKFSKCLVLTREGQSQRSLWKLPRCFAPRDGESMMTHHPIKRWRVGTDECTLRSVGRGQEFVIDTERCRGALSWARELISRGY